MKNLKPCPLCGGKAKIATVDYETHFVYCSECFVRTVEYYTKKEAIERWNTRKKVPLSQWNSENE